MKVVTAYNNFSRGRIDHDMNGRFDLPVYQSGADDFTNFISNFKGNAKYRAGLIDELEFQDCAMYEFKFNITQNYILVFYNTKLRFLSYDINGNFGWVLDGSSNILEVTTPYTLAESKQLSLAQNFDVVYIAHNNHQTRKLTRVSATSFTIGTFTITGDPFTSGSDWPGLVQFYRGRLYYGRSKAKITTIWGSKVGAYENLSIPGSGIVDDDPIQITLTDIAQRIEWMYAGDNSLIVGAADGIVAVNGGGVNIPIKAESVEANFTSADGCSGAYPIKKDGLIFYVREDERRVLFFKYDLLTESFQAQDANFISYDITQGNIRKLRYKKDKDDLIYCLKQNGDLLSLNFNEKEEIVGWHEHKTNGDIKDITIITDQNGDQQLFCLVERFGVFYIERLANYVEFKTRNDFFTNDEQADNDAYLRFVGEQLKDCVYLDNALTFSDLKTAQITYDPDAGTITAGSASFVVGDVGKHITYKTATGYEFGRFEITGYTSDTVVDVNVLQSPHANVYSSWYLSFTSVSGLSQYNGRSIGVVTDGGFLDDFNVSGGEITLSDQTNFIVVGYKYRGSIKSFCLGFQVKGQNTQTTMKAISRVGIRATTSAGGKFGTSPYRLENVQELRQTDLNYLPPSPIDGTKYATYVDDHQIEKYFYIVQDIPLPLNITSAMVEAKYTGGS